jgi:hypothetical protein
MNQDPCICGHSRLYHPASNAIINKCMALVEAHTFYSTGWKTCECLGFKLDNLKFLSQYEKDK